MRKCPSISKTMFVSEDYYYRIIGEDKSLSIKLGADAGDASTQDIILIRGPRTDVESAVKRIHQIVEDAKNDEIVNSYVRSSQRFLGLSIDLDISAVNRI